MSVRFELDNGKLKEYSTLLIEYGADGYYPATPYTTRCGLSFKKYPKDGACDHLDCAIYAARDRAIYPVGMYCLISIMMILIGWHENGESSRGDSRIRKLPRNIWIFFVCCSPYRLPGAGWSLTSIKIMRKFMDEGLADYDRFDQCHSRESVSPCMRYISITEGRNVDLIEYVPVCIILKSNLRVKGKAS